VAELNLHTLDKRVNNLEEWKDTMPETMDLKIRNAISEAILKLVGWVAGLLAVQSLVERFIGL
jgi:hypothetical protein